MEQDYGTVTSGDSKHSADLDKSKAQSDLPSTSQKTTHTERTGHQQSQISKNQTSSSPRNNDSKEESSRSLKNVQPSTSLESHYKLLYQTKVLSEFKSPSYISSICPTKEGVWTCDFVSDKVTLAKNGKVLSEIRYHDDVCITDISVSPSTGNLWACSEEDYSVMKKSLELETFKFRFSTEDKPLCICVTKNEHILIGMFQKIVKFTKKGNMVLSTTSMMSKKALVCFPYKMSECAVTENIAVVDNDKIGKGGNGKPHVLVMDKDFQALFRYRVYNGKGQKAFYPCDVTYDSAGNIVIGDYNNVSLHLLSGKGQYIRCIYNDTRVIQAVGILSDNVLWAVFGVDKVKVLQYTNNSGLQFM